MVGHLYLHLYLQIELLSSPWCAHLRPSQQSLLSPNRLCYPNAMDTSSCSLHRYAKKSALPSLRPCPEKGDDAALYFVHRASNVFASAPTISSTLLPC